MPSMEAERLLGRNLLFAPNMTEDMARVLGLCREPTPAIVLPLMEMWARQTRHHASIEQMAELYAWLCKRHATTHVDDATASAAAAEVRGRLASMRWLWLPDASAAAQLMTPARPLRSRRWYAGRASTPGWPINQASAFMNTPLRAFSPEFLCCIVFFGFER